MFSDCELNPAPSSKLCLEWTELPHATQRRRMGWDGCDQPVLEVAIQSLCTIWIWGQVLLPNFLEFSSTGMPNQFTLKSCLLFPLKTFQFTEDCSKNLHRKWDQQKNQNFVLSGSCIQRCEFWDTFMWLRATLLSEVKHSHMFIKIAMFPFSFRLYVTRTLGEIVRCYGLMCWWQVRNAQP